MEWSEVQSMTCELNNRVPDYSSASILFCLWSLAKFWSRFGSGKNLQSVCVRLYFRPGVTNNWNMCFLFTWLPALTGTLGIEHGNSCFCVWLMASLVCAITKRSTQFFCLLVVAHTFEFCQASSHVYSTPLYICIPGKIIICKFMGWQNVCLILLSH